MNTNFDHTMLTTLDPLEYQVHDLLWDQVDYQVLYQVRSRIQDQLKEQVWYQISDLVWGELRDQVGDSPWQA